MSRGYKLVSELLFAANVKNITGEVFVIEGHDLVPSASKGNVKNTIFLILPYEKDTYIIMYILTEDDKWKFIELASPLEFTTEEINKILDQKNKIKNLEKIQGSVIYVLDKDHLPKDITIRTSPASKYFVKNIIYLQKKAFYYGHFLSPNSEWKYSKNSEEEHEKGLD